MFPKPFYYADVFLKKYYLWMLKNVLQSNIFVETMIK